MLPSTWCQLWESWGGKQQEYERGTHDGRSNAVGHRANRAGRIPSNTRNALLQHVRVRRQPFCCQLNEQGGLADIRLYS